MDIEIIVIGESGKWVLNYPRIRIGMDPNCEVNLPPGRYPSVAGVHLVLEMVGGAVSLARDTPPGGDTYLNGHPANAGAAIRSGDILRLGAGGPELRIRLLERETYAPLAQHEPTSVQNHEPTRVITSQASAPYPSPPPVAPAAVGRQGYTAEAVRGDPAAPRTAVMQSAPSATEGEDMQNLESKLKSLQSILVVNLLIILVLLGCNIWQCWELSQTRDDVQQLRT
ncbi:MAG TPA: FHA domain-containing protein, partial [Terracidiphilus sp.]|nr:FHA domain-containing protein [Terracidiphilus sp.]